PFRKTSSSAAQRGVPSRREMLRRVARTARLANAFLDPFAKSGRIARLASVSTQPRSVVRQCARFPCEPDHVVEGRVTMHHHPQVSSQSALLDDRPNAIDDLRASTPSRMPRFCSSPTLAPRSSPKQTPHAGGRGLAKRSPAGSRPNRHATPGAPTLHDNGAIWRVQAPCIESIPLPSADTTVAPRARTPPEAYAGYAVRAGRTLQARRETHPRPRRPGTREGRLKADTGARTRL